ncbi:MAG TPA: hypothetical protein VGX26_09585 [Solirubrobacteraceae bacterium]|nr:hypothetical protein [Solirubrobacteraceae bacterium]
MPAACDELHRRRGAVEVTTLAGARLLGELMRRLLFDASATPQELRYAFRSTAVGGHYTSTGIYFQEQPIPLFDPYRSCVSYHTGPCQARPRLPAVLELAGSEPCNPKTTSTPIW